MARSLLSLVAKASERVHLVDITDRPRKLEHGMADQ
jgi:hypothetical protein